MQTGFVGRMVMVILIMAVFSFDRHLSGYFQPDLKTMIQNDFLPLHHDMPVRLTDHHEDVSCSFSTAGCGSPMVELRVLLIFDQIIIPKSNSGRIWQPPEPCC
jgi:hypothetical protein